MAIPRAKTILTPGAGGEKMTDRSAYRQKLEAQLDEWRAEIDKLQAKAVEAGADARIEYEKQVEELREQQKEAQERLEELNDAGEEAWDDLKDGVEKAWDNLGNAVQKAVERFG
jgi:uncharacterized coiled-coil DUF342 family protein